MIKAPFTIEPAISQAITAADWSAVIVLSDQLAEDITATPLTGVIKSWALVASGLAMLVWHIFQTWKISGTRQKVCQFLYSCN